MQEARRRENTFLFQNFEAVLPNSRECYFNPASDLGALNGAAKQPGGAGSVADQLNRIEPAETKQLLDRGVAIILDVSRAPEAVRIQSALRAQPNELAGWLGVLEPGKDAVTYCT